MNQTTEQGRRVLVVGGSRGIGRACVERFARNGDRVLFTYRANEEAAAEVVAAFDNVTAMRADGRLSEEARRVMAYVMEAWGGLDVLVYNAGIASIKLMTDTTDEEWRDLLDTNLSGAFYLSREAVRPMIAEHSGRVIHIGSMWGKVGASCEVAYSATKAGIRGLAMAMAKELAPSGITVNCVEPGVIDTDMNQMLDEDTRCSLTDEIPVGRFGTPADVAEAVFFLASAEAAFITGQIIGVDGGMAIGS